MTSRSLKQCGALFLVLLLTLSISLTVSAAGPPNSIGRFPDESYDGSSVITIHKYDLGDISPGSLTLEGTGEEQVSTAPIGGGKTLGDLTPLNDIEFLIEYYKFDETTGDYTVAKTAAEWGTPPSTGTFDDTMTYNGNPIYGYKGITANQGLLSFDNLNFGKYVVYEINSNGYIGQDDPFTVYVPTQLLTNKTATEWIYDVHVYPKNYDAGRFEKFLLNNDGERADPAQGDTAHGNRFIWELEVELRSLDGGSGQSAMEWIRIIDQIPAPMLLDPASVKLEFLEKGKTAVTDRVVLGSQYYTTELPAPINNNTLTVTLEGEENGPDLSKGLDYLVNQDAGTLILSITTFTDPANSKPGNVTNSGVYQWKEWNKNPGGKETPEPKNPSTELNDVIITKENDDADVMAGVKFILLKDGNAAAAYNDPASLNDTNCVIADISGTGLSRYLFTSNASGIVSINNIEAAHIPYGQSVPSVYYSYWLVEIETESGYNLLPGPVHIDFKEHGISPAAEITVVNHRGFTLPHTGGGGTILFTVVGLSLITIAGVIFVLFRRRRSRDNKTV